MGRAVFVGALPFVCVCFGETCRLIFIYFLLVLFFEFLDQRFVFVQGGGRVSGN